ncbi:HAD family hydrolase [Gulbenkiania mobilis]|uniref:HAD family hydrolase n=1 Tax=Gulbenkiania mobilis TaxID=397457 RepID=UPI0006BC0AE7|nr:HAD family phosphatase [Gulbenkiania mobilis]
MNPAWQATIFDLDGLMVDTESLGTASLSAAARSLGVTLAPQWLDDLVGLSTTRTLAYLCEHLPERTARAVYETSRSGYRRQLEEAEIPLRPGILPLLDWLADMTLPRAVATSTQRVLADLKLQRTGLDRYFPVSVAGDEVPATKPAPDLYLKAAACLGVPPVHCIALEDSPVGAEAALAAGMRVIIVPDMVQPSPFLARQALAVCPSLHEACEVLRGLC